MQNIIYYSFTFNKMNNNDLIRWIFLLSLSMISLIIIIESYAKGHSLVYSIITEIWIAVGIAIIVVYYSRKTEQLNQKTLKSIEKIVKYQHVETEWIKREARFKIIHDFKNILDACNEIILNAEKWEQESSEEKCHELKNQIISLNKKMTTDGIKNLISKEVVSTDFFSFYEIQPINLIATLCQSPLNFDEEKKKCNVYHLVTLQQQLPQTIERYEKDMSEEF